MAARTRPVFDDAAMDMVKMLLHQKSDPIMAYTPDRTLVYVNEAYDALFADRFPNGTVGLDVTQLEPDKAELIDEMVQANLRRRRDDPDLVIESPSIDADGKARWFEWRCLQSFDAEGNVQLVIAMSRDITAQRLAEYRMRRVAEQLEESNRDLLEFAQVASHDLQEPLRKVTTFAGRLESRLEDHFDDRSRDYMQRMNGAVVRMQNLIDDLLTFSRVNTRASVMEQASLGDAVTDVLVDLEVAIEEAGASITVGELPSLPVDISQIRQLFQNLIGNAIKFRREGVAPVIEIAATHVPANLRNADHPKGGWYDVTVADNGIGFDENYAKKVFVPFQRLHARSEYEGTGVGLSVCRRIVERHHGDISVSSTEGEGSTFTFRLPTSHTEHASTADDDSAQDAAILAVDQTIIGT